MEKSLINQLNYLGYVLFQTLIAKLFSNLSNVSVGLVGKLTFMFSSQWFKVLKRLTQNQRGCNRSTFSLRISCLKCGWQLLNIYMPQKTWCKVPETIKMSLQLESFKLKIRNQLQKCVQFLVKFLQDVVFVYVCYYFVLFTAVNIRTIHFSN